MRVRLLAAAAAVVLQPATGGAAMAEAPIKLAGPKPACSADGTALAVSAQDNLFDTACLAVPSDQPFTIAFDNRDRADHNVAILGHHGSEQTIFRGELIGGPRTVTYRVPQLTAGIYHFHCEVHTKDMMGVFAVESADAGLGSMDGMEPAMHARTDSGMGGAPADAGTAMEGPMATAPETAGDLAALPRTGLRSVHLFLLSAGLSLALGGFTIAVGARRVRPRHR